MKTQLLCVGQKMPAWVQQGYQDYAKRLPKDVSPKLQELNLAARRKTGGIAQWLEVEEKLIMEKINPSDFVVALAIKGQSLSTDSLAKKLTRWQLDGRNISFLIGGPDGLSQACLDRANFHWSLSDLTLPHPLVRIIFIEQYYRAWSLTQNHPYHK